MSKKTNTLLFILGATVLNVLVTAIWFTALFLLYVWLLAPRLPEAARAWGFPVIFIIAITLSFLIYRMALKHLIKKVNLGKYFEPLLGNGKPPRNESGPSGPQ
jgi:branched-subunit amino acid ABC-type transport system permease component